MEMDVSQQAALDSCSRGRAVSIIGAPGTGKTTVLMELVRREQANGSPRIVVVTQDRRAATQLRNSLAHLLGGLGDSIQVQSLTAFCFSIVQEYAQSVGRNDPELIAGPDEDALLSAIIEDPDSGVEFPSFVTQDVRELAEFRSEIRDLITRARELALSPQELKALGEEYDERIWRAGAHIMRLYDQVTEDQVSFSGLSQAADRLDHAQLVTTATHILSQWERHVSMSEGSAPIRYGELASTGITRPHWDWVVVDDIQNAPWSIVALLQELLKDGTGIVVSGDPDSAVQGFRGGAYSLPGDVCRPEPLGIDAQAAYLKQRYRGGEGSTALARRLSSYIRIGGGAAAQRRFTAPSGHDHIIGQRFVHEEEEVAWIARRIRHLHLLESVPFSEIAVVTRSRADHHAIRSSLVRRGIPVEQLGSDIPLREHPAVASLLDLVSWALHGHQVLSRSGAITTGLPRVLVSPMIGIDPLELSRMERTLRGCDLVMGGHRDLEQLLMLVCEGPEALESVASHGVDELMRAARIFQSIRRSAQRYDDQAEQVLWAAWDACGRAEVWRKEALSGGARGDAADSSLDAVIQLFRVAQRMADRHPYVSIDSLIEEISKQDLPEDSIARAGASVDAVCLTTPSASIGRSWDHIVIAGLQEGVWPNLRLRDTLTHTSRLSSIVMGREVPGLREESYKAEAYEEVLDDELRQLHFAVTRARQSICITCVENDDARPSRFVSALGFHWEEAEPRTDLKRSRGVVEGGAPPIVHAPIMALPRPYADELDSIALVGILRQILYAVPAGSPESRRARDLLARLSASGVVSADERAWYDVLPERAASNFVSGSPQPGPVSVSPSGVEKMLECPLRGFLSSVGGERKDTGVQASIGTLIHSLAERFPAGGLEELLSAFDTDWRREFGDPESSAFGQAEYDKRRNQVINLAKYLQELPPALETEKFVSAELPPDIVLRAVIDRVSVDDHGNIRIVDFKTGKPISKTQVADHPQLQLYQWALSQTAHQDQSGGGPGEPASAELIFLSREWDPDPKKRFVQQKLDEKGVARAESRVREVGRLLRGQNFPANPNESLCKVCAFRRVCPAQPEGAMFS